MPAPFKVEIMNKLAKLARGQFFGSLATQREWGLSENPSEAETVDTLRRFTEAYIESFIDSPTTPESWRLPT
jgi:hypothetical protein